MRDYLFHIFSHIHDVNKDIKWNCGHEIVWFFSEWCINVFFLIDVSMIFFWLTYRWFFSDWRINVFSDWRIDGVSLIDVSMIFFWLTYRWFFLIDVSMIFSDWHTWIPKYHTCMFTLLESDLIYEKLVPNKKLWFSSTL